MRFDSRSVVKILFPPSKSVIPILCSITSFHLFFLRSKLSQSYLMHHIKYTSPAGLDCDALLHATKILYALSSLRNQKTPL